MKKRNFLLLLTMFFLASCDGWSYTVPTFPAPPPTITPSIYSPTPVIVTATSTSTDPTSTPTQTATQGRATETGTAVSETPTPTDTATITPPTQPLTVEILGCNTSIDITHAMGEVTNAYVTLKNTTGADIPDLCATLIALDEGRVHPDKTVCVPSLENGQQVTLKLTADSTSNQESSIQIEAKSGETLLSRMASTSCTEVGLFAPAPDMLGTPVPIQ